jgi:isocitrate lyase
MLCPQAVQMAKAGLKAIYLSGWQVGLADRGWPSPNAALPPADSA